MQTTEQKLREALQGFLTAMEQGLSLTLAAEYARQALALPTAEKELTDEEAMKIINDLGKHDMAVRHLQASGFRWVGDEGKWVQTAAPVGEREAFIVSAVLIKETTTGFNMQNKLYEVAAASRDEAHGKVLPLIYVDFPEHRLHTICSYPITSPALSAGDAVKPVFKVYKGEVCYKSEGDDQSYGMWCPISWEYKPPFPEGTEFVAAMRKDQL